MPYLKIILLSMLAVMAYGILHDMVTAHVCVEYFTIGHPMIVPTRNPILLALFWGVFATWWVGIMLGLPLAMACRMSKRPTINAMFLVRPMLILACVAGLCALIAGIVGWQLARLEMIQLNELLAGIIPEERHARFLADGFAHTTSYGVAFIGGLVLIAWIWHKRGTMVEFL